MPDGNGNGGSGERFRALGFARLRLDELTLRRHPDIERLMARLGTGKRRFARTGKKGLGLTIVRDEYGHLYYAEGQFDLGFARFLEV